MVLPSRLKNWLIFPVYLLLLMVASGYFLRPASTSVVSPSLPAVLLSDGTDSLTVPFQESTILKTWEDHPRHLLYGSIYTNSVNSPEGFGLWIPWIERLLVVTLSYALPEEKIPSAMIWSLVLLNGVCFALMGLTFRWHPIVWIPLSLAYALTPYVRARAMAHHVLAGVYAFPLVIAALEVLARKTSSHLKVLLSAALLLAAVTSAHYYLVVLIGISPLLACIFLYRHAAHHGYSRWYSLENIFSAGGKALLSATPAALFLAWNRAFSVPPEVTLPTAALPTGYFMSSFAAKPLDYLTGDIFLGSVDLNPLRAWLSSFARNHLGSSSTIESSNGIRWSVLLIAVTAIIRSFKSRTPSVARPGMDDLRPWYWMGVFTLWLSLSPHVPFFFLKTGIGASGLLHRLIPQFRVPSRVGPCFHLAILLISGSFLQLRLRALTQSPSWHKPFLACSLFLGILFLDYPALQPARTEPIAPRWTHLEALGTECGRGMLLPYHSVLHTGPNFYFFRLLQSFRRTRCQMMNRFVPDDAEQALQNRFGSEVFAEALTDSHQRQALGKDLHRFLSCTGARWVHWTTASSLEFGQALCSEWGWRWNQGACIREDIPRSLEFDPEPSNCWRRR